MHHVALDRAGPDDGHLHDEVVETFGAEPRQHGHLRAGFHLEHAHAVGALQHLVHLGILRRNLLHREAPAAEVVDEVERLADRRQHAEAEHVHLEEPQGFEVVLVPLDDGTVVHGRVLDRHEFGQGAARDDEAADVLRQVPGEAEYLVHEVEELAGDLALWVEASGSKARVDRFALVPPGHGLRQQVDQVEVEPQGFADIADGASRPVGDERGGQRRTIAAVALVDVLDHLLAPLVLEVDVDVRRFVALLRDEALEQEAHARRIHFSDVQAIADRRIGRGAAALAQDA